MGKLTWNKNNPLMINLRAPQDKSPNPALPTAVVDSEMKNYLFDPLAQSVLTEALAPQTNGTLTVAVDPTELWDDGDILEVRMDDGKRVDLLITDRDAGAKTVDWTGQTTALSSIGSRCIKKLGPTVDGAAYGATQDLEELDWGYVVYLAISQTTFYAVSVPQDVLLLEIALETAGVADWTRSWPVQIVEPKA
jgi:hypothetical protein